MYRIANLERVFNTLGLAVGHRPLLILILTVLISFYLAQMAVLHHWNEVETDLERLFAPQVSQAVIDRSQIETLFPANYSEYIVGHETRVMPHVRVIIVLNDYALPDMQWSSTFWSVAEQIDKVFTSDLVAVNVDGKQVKYSDVCPKFGAKCVAQNDILDIMAHLDAIKSGQEVVKFPVMNHSQDGHRYLVPSYLGNLTLTDDRSEVKTFNMIRLTYQMRDDTPHMANLSRQMERTLSQHVRRQMNVNESSGVQVHVCTSTSLEEELSVNIQSSLDNLYIGVSAIVTFATLVGFSVGHGNDSDEEEVDFLSNFRMKILTSKPVVTGLLGFASCITGIVTGFAMAMILDYPWQDVTLAGLFLLIGIGMDDVFVMISNFGHMNRMRPVVGQSNIKPCAESDGHILRHCSTTVAAQMAICYAQSATSITLTSMTNVASFAVGALLSNYRSVSTFCTYTGYGMICLYCHVFLVFGPCLSLAVRLEHLISCGRSGVCQQMQPTMMPASQYKVDLHSLFGRFGLTLRRAKVKIFICIMYIAYLIMSVLSLSYIEEGIDVKHLAVRHTAIYNFTHLEEAFFRSSPYRIQLVISNSSGIDLKDDANLQEVRSLVTRLVDTDYIMDSGDVVENWLNEYQRVANFGIFGNTSELSSDNIEQFITMASGTPLVDSVVLSDVARLDTNLTNKSVTAFRIFLQSDKILDTNGDRQMLRCLQIVVSRLNETSCGNSSRQLEHGYNRVFNVAIFSPFFVQFEQYIHLTKDSLISASVGCFAMFVVAMLILGDLLTASLIVPIIISVCLGILKTMTLFDIRLDAISIICLIITIGASVDFSAHIASFCVHHRRQAITGQNYLIAASIECYGPPICQAAFSTVLVVAPLIFVDSYILKSFATLMIAVSLLGAAHALIVMPIFLDGVYLVKACRSLHREPKSSAPPSEMSDELSVESSIDKQCEMTQTADKLGRALCLSLSSSSSLSMVETKEGREVGGVDCHSGADIFMTPKVGSILQRCHSASTDSLRTAKTDECTAQFDSCSDAGTIQLSDQAEEVFDEKRMSEYFMRNSERLPNCKWASTHSVSRTQSTEDVDFGFVI